MYPQKNYLIEDYLENFFQEVDKETIRVYKKVMSSEEQPNDQIIGLGLEEVLKKYPEIGLGSD